MPHRAPSTSNEAGSLRALSLIIDLMIFSIQAYAAVQTPAVCATKSCHEMVALLRAMMTQAKVTIGK